MAENKIDIVNRQIDAYVRGDWQTFRSMLTDDVCYEEEATHRRVEGADKYLDILKAWKSAFPDLKVNIRESFASGDAVVVELEWTGTHKGALSGPMGTIPATGRSGKLPAMVLNRFDGDRIREVKHYFDLMTLMTQLGVMPQPGATTSASPR